MKNADNYIGYNTDLVLKEIQELSGKDFDPQLIELFIHVIKEMDESDFDM
ncbi:hypothetical protein [Anaerotignum sp.]|nr:hypothetical protein [Anaerotignum sp.]